MSSTPIKVSQSKVNAYRRCPKAYHYKYVENIQRIRLARPLKFGGIVHKMAEAEVNGQDPFEVLEKVAKENRRLFKEEREMYGEIIADIDYIMTAYYDFWKDEPLEFVAHKGKLVEIPFEIPYNKHVTIKGTFDGVAKARKRLWLAEHKTHKKFPNVDHRWRNLQPVVYIRVAEMLGWWKLEGTLWDYIRSKPPTRPQILKSGGLSTRDIDTLPQVIIDTAKQAGLPRAAYQPLVDESKRKLSDWFQRIFTPIKKPVLDRVFRDFITTAEEMYEKQDDKDPPRYFGRHCEWCDFEPLCRATMQGLDEKMIREREYERSTYEDRETEEETND